MSKWRQYLSGIMSFIWICSCLTAGSWSKIAYAADKGERYYDVVVSEEDQQTVKGWGVFPAWNRVDWQREFMNRTGAQQALYEDLGITMFRVMLTPFCGDGEGNLVEEKMEEVYDLVRLGHEKGIDEYIISIWSMPVQMKTIETVNGWTGSAYAKLRTDKEDAYTSFLVNAIEWLVDRGCEAPKAISFQNEPLSQIISEWCFWGGDNGAQYQRVAKKLRTKLDGAGLTNVLILAPEGAAYHENEELLGHGFSALGQDPELRDAIGGFASHSYIWEGRTESEALGGLQSYKAAADNFPEKDRWQTEYCPLIRGVSDMDMALYTARRLTSDMAYIENNYWFWWLGWDHAREPEEVGEVLLAGSDGVQVTKTKSFYLLSKIFNHVPVGSKVRRVSIDPGSGLIASDATWMDGVAFVDGDTTVLLLTNPTNEAKGVHLKGLSGVTADMYITTQDIPYNEDMGLAATRNVVEGEVLFVDLPPESISVVITTGTDTAPPYIRFDQQGSSLVRDADYAAKDPIFTLTGSLDERGELLINGESVVIEEDLSFRKTINLDEGLNRIQAVAIDERGNQGSPRYLDIRHDSSYLGVTLDQDELVYVNKAVFSISGKVNSQAVLEVTRNGETEEMAVEKAPEEQYGFFQKALNLEPGDNNILVMAKDSLYCSDPAELLVIYDQDAPVITIFTEDGSTAPSQSIFIQGSVNEWVQLWINGVHIRLQEGYTFHAIVPIQEGENIIQVEAQDRAGNQSVQSITIYGIPGADGALSEGVGVSYHASQPMEIDGDLSEEPWKIDHLVENVILGESDNHVTFGSLWDEEYLYIGVRVLDADLRNDSEQGYMDDSIEIYIDGKNDKSSLYGPDDHQITLGWSDAVLSAGRDLEGIRLGQKDIEGGYTVEIAIPWESIGIDSPGVNGVIGFDMGCNDDDGNNNGNRDGQLMWYGNGDNWQNTSSFGILYLSDGRQTAAATKPQEPIQIDGKLEEDSWRLVNRAEKDVIGASDNGVRFGTLCDEQYLYIGIEVLDADLRNDSEAPYLDDSVEIYLNGDIDTLGLYDENDYQIIIRWNDPQVFLGGGKTIEGILVGQADIAGGYTVEVAIPWEGLHVTPIRYMTLGLDIGNNDDDGENNGNRDAQLMWNGDGDNWQYTDNFGYLLVCNDDFPLEGGNDEEPEGLLLFVDEGENLEKIYAKSSQYISVADWEPNKFGGDADRICHTNDYPEMDEYVIYQSQDGDIYSFDIVTGLFEGTPQFKIYGSADGESFTELWAESTRIGGEQSFEVYRLQTKGIKSGIRYLKIEFPGRENWKEHICRVSFQYFGKFPEETEPGECKDYCVDFEKVYEKSSKVEAKDWMTFFWRRI